MIMALTGRELAEFAKSKVGTPYVYGAKGAEGPFTQAKLNSLAKSYPGTFTALYISKAKKYIGKVCTDCSGLISWYTGKVIGSSQMYSTASKRIPISQISNVPVGAVLWKSGHVGVYLGDGLVAEAKGINYGTVITKVSATAWKYALLFSYISYDTSSATSAPVKGKNPYTQPTATMKKGSRGEGVKWVQWELTEAGYDFSKHGGIDGDFGSYTEQCVRQFQTSCKIGVDGKVGSETREKMIQN